MEMYLRKLSLENEAEIKALIRTAFAIPPWNDDWRDEEVFSLYLTDLIGNKNSLALGLYAGDELKALALGRVKHWFNGTEFCIDDLCVSPESQGRGFGSALIRELKAYAGANKIARITLKTNKNARAYEFYLKNGFAEEGDWVELRLDCVP